MELDQTYAQCKESTQLKLLLTPEGRGPAFDDADAESRQWTQG